MHGCKRAKGKQCSSLFIRYHYEEYRQQCAALTRDELDLILLDQIMEFLSNERELDPGPVRLQLPGSDQPCCSNILGGEYAAKHSKSCMEFV